MEWYKYLIIAAGGVLVGFINTLSGSGSAISLPLLIFMGLPANVANGTNRVGIMLQNLVGTGSFYQKKVLDLRGALILAVPGVLGSLLGAQIAVNLDEVLMRRVIGVVMILMLVLLLARPQRWLNGQTEALQGFPSWKHLLLFFVIGLYGGFIQVGVGIFLLSGLVLSLDYNLLRANAVKVAINLCFTVAALLVFQSNGQVEWAPGLALAAGTMLGARIAANFAIQRGTVWVHRLVIVVVAFSALNLLGVFEAAALALGIHF